MDLCDNGLVPEDVEYLTKALQNVNSKLTSMDLRYNNLNPKPIENIDVALTRNKIKLDKACYLLNICFLEKRKQCEIKN